METAPDIVKGFFGEGVEDKVRRMFRNQLLTLRKLVIKVGDDELNAEDDVSTCTVDGNRGTAKDTIE